VSAVAVVKVPTAQWSSYHSLSSWSARRSFSGKWIAWPSRGSHPRAGVIFGGIAVLRDLLIPCRDWGPQFGVTCWSCRIGFTISAANAAAAAPTTGLLAAGADEVSAAVAALFGAHGQAHQALSAQAAAFHQEFVRALSAGAGSYAGAEAAAASPLQSLLDPINAQVQATIGRPLIGNGTNGTPGTGQDGTPGGWLVGNCEAGGSGAAGTGGAGGTGGRDPAADVAGLQRSNEVLLDTDTEPAVVDSAAMVCPRPVWQCDSGLANARREGVGGPGLRERQLCQHSHAGSVLGSARSVHDHPRPRRGCDPGCNSFRCGSGLAAAVDEADHLPFVPMLDPHLNFPIGQYSVSGFSQITGAEGQLFRSLGLIPSWWDGV